MSQILINNQHAAAASPFMVQHLWIYTMANDMFAFSNEYKLILERSQFGTLGYSQNNINNIDPDECRHV